MKLPKNTKKDKRTEAEKVIDKKIEDYAKSATTADEIMKSQQMFRNRVEIQNGRKKTIMGLPPETVFAGAVSLIQIGAILKVEDLKAVTSKAMAFVHKGRLR